MKTTVAHVKITRDMRGTTIYMKSAPLWALLKKFANDRTTPTRTADKKVWYFSSTYPELIGNYSGDIYNLICSTELNEGVTLVMPTPTTKRWAEDLANKLKRDVERTISDYCVIYNIEMVWTTNNDVVQLNATGLAINSGN